MKINLPGQACRLMSFFARHRKVVDNRLLPPTVPQRARTWEWTNLSSGISAVSQNGDGRGLPLPCYFFLVRLKIARAKRPVIKPAIMDSQGKPGIAGIIIGVETELVEELKVVVGVLETVTVDTSVLTIVIGALVVT